MKLEKYLADYIDHQEDIDLEKTGRIIHTTEDMIREGIEAFESIEGVKIHIDNAGDITDDSEEHK